MKILYVGNFSVDFSTETHVSATLASMGHEVWRAQENEIMPGTLLRDVTVFEPDLVLWTRTWPGFVTANMLTEIKKLGIPTASYHLDLYVPLQRNGGIGSDPFWDTDYVFTADGDPKSAAVFREKGINHHWLRPGVFKRECIQGKAKEEYTANVAFIGSTVPYHPEWPYRQKLVDFLRITYGGWFKIYGAPYKGVRYPELNDVFASTKVIVGDTLCPNFTHENYWSDRVYETTGRGGFIIHPRIKGLERDFKEHEEIEFYNYGDFDHLRQLIDWYIEHDDYRETVRKNGMIRTKHDHTYHNRMRELLEVVHVN